MVREDPTVLVEKPVPKRGCMAKEDQVVVVEQPMALEEDTR